MTVYVTGDIHGISREVRERLVTLENQKAEDVIIVAGDAALEYGVYSMNNLKEEMKNFIGDWFIVRGNHDNRYWRNHTSRSDKDEIIAEDGWNFSNKYGAPTLYQNEYPNIHYSCDTGEIYTLDNFNILTIPGGFSIDGDYRLDMGLPFEVEERLSYKEAFDLYEYIEKHYKEIDFVIAHIMPYKLESELQDWYCPGVEQSKINKDMERWIDTYMNIIETSPRFKHYFSGHYHDNYQFNDKYSMLLHKVVKMEDYCGN